MNENKMIYYTKFIIRIVLACMSWLLLVVVLRYLTDITIWLKALLLIGLLGAMFLNIYNGRENRYKDFKQRVEELSKLDEGSFTYFIERLYRTLGYYTKIQGKTSGLKKVNEIVLMKEQEQIVMQCYNKQTIGLDTVQQLVGRMSFYPPTAKGQLLLIGRADEKVHQLAKLNDITIIEGSTLQAQMIKASTLLETYLDGAISAFWCHPLKWFRKHFLEAEPRFMNHETWLQWVKLALRNRDYQLNDAQSPKEYGVQFVAQKGADNIAIKCIGINHKVTENDLNALKASIPFYEVTKAMLITNSKVTYAARKLAKRYQIKLLNFDDFMQWLKTQDELQKNECQEK